MPLADWQQASFESPTCICVITGRQCGKLEQRLQISVRGFKVKEDLFFECACTHIVNQYGILLLFWLGGTYQDFWGTLTMFHMAYRHSGLVRKPFTDLDCKLAMFHMVYRHSRLVRKPFTDLDCKLAMLHMVYRHSGLVRKPFTDLDCKLAMFHMVYRHSRLVRKPFTDLDCKLAMFHMVYRHSGLVRKPFTDLDCTEYDGLRET